MSIKSYLQTVEAVLEKERQRNEQLIILRPGMRRSYTDAEREIGLPYMGAAAFSMALGAVMTGMHAVLDLRDDAQCSEWLSEAVLCLPQNACPAITIIIGAQEANTAGAVYGVQRFFPKTPRQAAGFLRAALRCEGMTMVVLDEEYSDMIDDVPDEYDFAWLSNENPAQDDLWEDIVEAQAPCAVQQTFFEENTDDPTDEIDEEQPWEDVQPEEKNETEETEEVGETEEAEGTMQGENQTMQQSENICPKQPASGMNMCATRMISYCPERLEALCAELSAPMQTLVEKCVMRVYERFPSFECRYEEEAAASECAFIPPEQEDAAIWIGRDRISVAYNAAKVSHDSAARMLRELCRLLNKPTLLIYDGEGNA